MRNPWPMMGILVLTGVVFGVYAKFFADQRIWMMAFMLIMVLVLAFWAYGRYSNWLVLKLNNVVKTYQDNRDLEMLKAEFKKWRFVSSKYARDVMRINWIIALMEHERFDEAKAQLEALRLRAETTYDWLNYHIILADYAGKTGDKALARQETRTAEAIKKKIESKQANPKERATKLQCKRAFLNWAAFTVVLFVGGALTFWLCQASILGSIGVAAFTLSWFAAPMTIGWGVLWATR